ncbi:hypothetical protein [Deinococcus aluminii]|uniref:Uncharacterized protein n=1 Tax=Deinococcus aluminii TaxID=1656885 RepID=A0ABP9XES2_9DEIO
MIGTIYEVTYPDRSKRFINSMFFLDREGRPVPMGHYYADSLEIDDVREGILTLGKAIWGKENCAIIRYDGATDLLDDNGKPFMDSRDAYMLLCDQIDDQGREAITSLPKAGL